MSLIWRSFRLLLTPALSFASASNGYDPAGNRLWDRVTQKNVGTTSYDNYHSWSYQYDGLHRLIGAGTGKLEPDPPTSAGTPQIAMGVSGGPLAQGTSWSLDNLGNWAGSASQPDVKYLLEQQPYGLVAAKTIDHAVNRANEITQLTTQENNQPVVTAYVVHDPAGNLIFDGQFVYQYDAWNRLIQVNEMGAFPVPLNGQILSEDYLGQLVCRYTYDGLGRLIAGWRSNPPMFANDRRHGRQKPRGSTNPHRR